MYSTVGFFSNSPHTFPICSSACKILSNSLHTIPQVSPLPERFSSIYQTLSRCVWLLKFSFFRPTTFFLHTCLWDSSQFIAHLTLNAWLSFTFFATLRTLFLECLTYWISIIHRTLFAMCLTAGEIFNFAIIHWTLFPILCLTALEILTDIHRALYPDSLLIFCNSPYTFHKVPDRVCLQWHLQASI